MDRGPPGSSVCAVFLAGTLEWVAISFSNICVCSRTSTKGRSSSNSTVVPPCPCLSALGLRRNALPVEPQGAGATWLLPASGIPSSLSSAWLGWRDCVSLKLQEEVASQPKAEVGKWRVCFRCQFITQVTKRNVATPLELSERGRPSVARVLTAYLERNFILLSSPDLQTWIIATQLPKPLAIHGKETSSHNGRPVKGIKPSLKGSEHRGPWHFAWG